MENNILPWAPLLEGLQPQSSRQRETWKPEMLPKVDIGIRPVCNALPTVLRNFITRRTVGDTVPMSRCRDAAHRPTSPSHVLLISPKPSYFLQENQVPRTSPVVQLSHCILIYRLIHSSRRRREAFFGREQWTRRDTAPGAHAAWIGAAAAIAQRLFPSVVLCVRGWLGIWRGQGRVGVVESFSGRLSAPWLRGSVAPSLVRGGRHRCTP